MLFSLRRGRGLTRTLIWVVLGGLSLLAGCAGADLSKRTYERTTITPTPGSGPVNEPSLAPAALRDVDVCALLAPEVMRDIGTPDGEPYATNAESCSRSFTDARGNEVRVGLTLGDAVVGLPEKATGGIEGLPARADRLDEDTCFVDVLTSEDPAMGVRAHLSAADGDACVTGYTVLGQVIRQLRSAPPRVDVVRHSLRTLDVCTRFGTFAMGRFLGGDIDARPYRLHGCHFSAGSRVAMVRFRFGRDILTNERTKKTTLPGGVTAFVASSGTGTADCDVEWVHRRNGDHIAETVRVSYQRVGGDETPKQACRKAVTLAKSVLPELPGN
ncbi:hypothetical protein [Haloechinothrix salitolerans]|uniref:DUF3558 domain-containing protein n=1 Tax=Haloechinothrix salitolerans TaxID=926830 RepID=A0ABW2C5S3_9PSEU